MVIIKNGEICQNEWRHLNDDETPPPDGGITVSLKRWQAEKAEWLARGTPIGVRLESNNAVEELAKDLGHLHLVVLGFKPFTDGRNFSVARILRERFGFEGEIRAQGEFIRDQIFFLSRVGVNAFEFTSHEAAEQALPALREFTVKYQAAADVAEPLYRRRG